MAEGPGTSPGGLQRGGPSSPSRGDARDRDTPPPAPVGEAREVSSKEVRSDCHRMPKLLKPQSGWTHVGRCQPRGDLRDFLPSNAMRAERSKLKPDEGAGKSPGHACSGGVAGVRTRWRREVLRRIEEMAAPRGEAPLNPAIGALVARWSFVKIARAIRHGLGDLRAEVTEHGQRIPATVERLERAPRGRESAREEELLARGAGGWV